MKKIKQKNISEEVVLTKPQRLCMDHLFRNFAFSLSCVIELIENPRTNVTPTMIAECFGSTVKRLNFAMRRLKENSGCVLTNKECKLVGHFVGCKKVC